MQTISPLRLTLLLLTVGASLAACSGTPTDDDESPSGTPAPTANPLDGDLDGYGLETDCDDNDAASYPGAAEACDSKDNDCDNSIDEGDPPGGSTWYGDADGDGYGSLFLTTTSCLQPTGYVESAGDCNDGRADINPGATEVCDDNSADEDCDGLINDLDSSVDPSSQNPVYLDGDGDGYGAGEPVLVCELEAGFSSIAGDCDDSDPAFHPGATESCEADVDYNCDGSTSFVDADQDGHPACEDCDDSDPAINPSALEICDEGDVDEDCDGLINDSDPSTDPASQTPWYHDVDIDGYGSATDVELACEDPTSSIDWWSANALDCDDRLSAVNPDQVELCNGRDDNCDGQTDEDAGQDAATWFLDQDGDGYGDAGATRESCARPDGYVDNSDDCDDDRAAINPGATELCDEVDNNCDGRVDEDKSQDASTWYEDNDSDGFGDFDAPRNACLQPTGYVAEGGDCDDSRANVNPGESEVCDAANLDEDCDDKADDDDPGALGSSKTRYYLDGDGDGYGTDVGAGALYCDPPAGYAPNNDDCDDSSAAINPAAVESCVEELDLNCDGAVGITDNDGDGVAACEDCNDFNPRISPEATEVCDSANVDEDCSGAADDQDPGVSAASQTTFYHDVDSDGYGDAAAPALYCDDPTTSVDWWSRVATDCDDRDGDVHPGATELCNGSDDDCDSRTDESGAEDASVWYADTDGDGYGDPTATTRACRRPEGHVATGTDCDDDRPGAYPGADEACNTLDEDCDGRVDEGQVDDGPEWYRDTDGDGYGDDNVTVNACLKPSGYKADKGDCDDTDASINPDATEICDPGNTDEDCDGLADDNDPDVAEDTQHLFYADTDADGYGTGEGILFCDLPRGYASSTSDCDDNDAEVNPGADETCIDEKDLNCDGFVGFTDNDGDGVAACEDCNDNNAAINPSAVEVCDPGNADEDCDGLADDNDPSATGKFTYHHDLDTDGFGAPDATASYCDDPSTSIDWWTLDSTDCNDRDSDIHPGAPESCDGADEDCDSRVDEDPTDPNTYYRDTDADSYGTASPTVAACATPEGYANTAGDCDDLSAAINPAADERCDGVDNDCDGSRDELGAVDGDSYYPDTDGDGVGGLTSPQRACAALGEGYTTATGDCDDRDAGIYPGAPERCDGEDGDCDGTVDEAAEDRTSFYLDNDGDGYGQPETASLACVAPEGYAPYGGDCDDTDDDIYPGAPEFCSDVADLNCDGSTGLDDNDADGYPACEECNDLDPDAFPGADELCDGEDTDCDGVVDEGGALDATAWYPDADGDSYGNSGGSSVTACDSPTGYVANDDDCDDTLFYINPEGLEYCDGRDEDCDGAVDESGADGTAAWVDSDGDGFGDTFAAAQMLCEVGAGFSTNHSDCDDASAAVNPSATESCTDVLDNNCNGLADCDDSSCATSTICTGGETCDNSIDDDGDLAVDCGDTSCTAAPSCDGITCADAPSLGSLVGSATASTAGKPNNFQATCGGGARSPDFTFVWRAPYAGTFVFDTLGSSYDTVLHLRSACGGVALDCSDDIGQTNRLSELSRTMAAGQELLIIVDGYSTSTVQSSGTFKLNISLGEQLGCGDGRDNDDDGAVDCDDSDCADAPGCAEATPTPTPPPDLDGDTCETAIVATEGTYTGNTVGAQHDYEGTTCTGYPSQSPDEAYLVHLEAGQTLTASVDPAGWDTSIFLLNDCASPATECLAGQDFYFEDLAETLRYTAQVTRDVYLIVGGYETANAGSYTLDIVIDDASSTPTPTPPPSLDGDTCESALPLTEGVITASNTGYSNTYSATGCNFSSTGPDRTYFADLLAGETLKVVASSITTNLDLSIWLMSDCALPASACLDGSDRGNPESVLYTATSDETVYLIVDGYNSGDVGTYTLTVDILSETPTCPEIDLGSSLGDAVYSGNSAVGTNDFQLSCTAGSGGRDVALRWEAPYTGTFTFETEGVGIDTVLGLLDGGCDAPELVCSDDVAFPNDLSSRVEATLTAGQVITVVVDGYNGASSGSYTLNILGEPAAYNDDLLISEYVEGSSFNKALEIYNGTGQTVDLSEYQVRVGSNGAAFDAAAVIPLAGSLAQGEVYVIAHGQAAAGVLLVADYTTAACNWNGDDAIALVHGSAAIDTIDRVGQMGVDPGASWPVAGVTDATINNTLVRKSTVTSGNLNWSSSAGTNLLNSEWQVLDNDDISGLGVHP